MSVPAETAGRPLPAGAPAWLRSVPAWFPIAALALAALAAATLLWEPAGLGVTVVAGGIAVSAALLSPRRDAWTIAWWVCALGLCLMPTLRAAAWVVVLSLLAAVVLGAVAAGGAATFRAAAAAIGWWIAASPIGSVFIAALATRRVTDRGAAWLPVVRGVVLAVPLLVVFGALFAGADAAFADLLADLSGWVPEIDEDIPLRGFIAVLVASVAGGYAYVAHRPAPAEPTAPPARVGRTEWLIALGSLAVLFSAFVILQLTALFGGHDFVARTAGLTYAEYARGGFGELTTVAALTLAVLAASRRWAHRQTAADERLLRALLGVLCLLTLVVLVSALRRLGLYVDAFGQTPSRYLARTEILWLGGVFALVIASGLVRSGAWLPRAVVTLTAVTALAFGVSDPDRRIAERNVDRYQETRKVDLSLLSELSADAVPAIEGSGLEVCVNIPAADGLAGYNRSRHAGFESDVRC